MYIFSVIFLFIVLAGLYIIFRFATKNTLSKEEKKLFYTRLVKISNLPSTKEQVIDFDKLYHHILKTLKYDGGFGDILKQKPIEIENLDKIWELHKLRNKLVHDFNSYDNLFLEKKSIEYKLEIEKILIRS